MELIDKGLLIKEIKRIRDKAFPNSEWNHGYAKACESIISLLDTLEVKEVDLWTELGNYIEHYRNRETGYTLFDIAKHFFELGLKTQKGDEE